MTSNDPTPTIGDRARPEGTSRLWLALALGLLLGFGPFLATHPFNLACDGVIHLRVARDLAWAVADEPGYPDWDARAYGGRGGPMFRFLGPLPLAGAVVLQFVGFSVPLAVKLVVLLYALLGAWGLCRWFAALGLDEFRDWALFLWLTNPFLIWFLTFGFVFQNLCAVFLIPWVAAGMSEAGKEGRSGWHTAALSLGLMSATHLQTTLMTAIGLGVWAVCQAFFAGSPRWRPPVRVLGAAAFAFFLAAPYILPAMITRGETTFFKGMAFYVPGRENTPFLDGASPAGPGAPVPIDRQFLAFTSFLAARWTEVLPGLEAVSGQWYNKNEHGNVFALDPFRRFEIFRPWLLLAFLLMVPFTCLGAGRPGADPAFPFGVAALALAFMNVSWSAPIWSHLTILHPIQFPWRFLLPALTFGLPWMGRAGTVWSRHRPGLLLAGVLLPWLGLGLAFTSLTRTLPWDRIARAMNEPGNLEAFIPSVCPDPAQVSEKTGEYHEIALASGGGEIELLGRGFSWAQYQVRATGTEAAVRINTHADPWWRARFAGGEIPLQTDPTQGTLIASLPGPTGRLDLFRRKPPGRDLGWILMLAAMVFWGFSRPRS